MTSCCLCPPKQCWYIAAQGNLKQRVGIAPYDKVGRCTLPRRPGDTIRICRGEHLAEGVAIRHPLQILGEPGSTLRCREHQAESALDVHSNVRIEGLCIHAARAACVRHHSGHLQIKGCRLECDPQRFDHLYCALVTLVRKEHVATHAKRKDELSVEATVISGSLRAVRSAGDGTLRDVRVCYEGSQKLFWFAVAQEPTCGVACAVVARLGGDRSAIEEKRPDDAEDIALQRSLERKRQRREEYTQPMRQHCI